MIRIHKILCFAEDISVAQQNVQRFLKKSMLIQYDMVKTIQKLSLCASDESFWPEVDDAIEQNKMVLNKHLSELKEAGCHSIEDCATLEQGYPSKLFHIVAHLIDGFIGIDSDFYCLPEDSHWLSEKLKNTILADPDKYWLIHTEGHFDSASDASIIHT